jgi:hypothetical protein
MSIALKEYTNKREAWLHEVEHKLLERFSYSINKIPSDNPYFLDFTWTKDNSETLVRAVFCNVHADIDMIQRFIPRKYHHDGQQEHFYLILDREPLLAKLGLGETNYGFSERGIHIHTISNFIEAADFSEGIIYE